MRRGLVFLLVCVLLSVPFSPAHARERWKRRIDRLVSGHSMSVSVRDAGEILYGRGATTRRAPASVEKLLVSMALLDSLGENKRIRTTATAETVAGGVVAGDLWLLGRGDPTVTGGNRYLRSLPFKPTRLGRLARHIKEAGVTAIHGRVMGSTGYFGRDWWAQGWKSDFPRRYIPLPSALTFQGNVHKGRHIADPERYAARSLKRRLEDIGIKVTGVAGSGSPTAGLQPVAYVKSAPLSSLMLYMNRHSSNFFAEVLGKRLGREVAGRGTIAAGARAARAWAAASNVTIETHDSSGLSYSNRVSPRGVTRLLAVAESRPWGSTLRGTLARGGQGTLENRLQGVPVRAKTGTLDRISALSGWAKLKRTNSWAEFSIMSYGMYKSSAVSIEDRIVRILHRGAR
jgi:D-alanyl-D-alanine carboxypeptidase/D-alanyl-D-alanine-endopeptidase (penicillin-binding protein 4)